MQCQSCKKNIATIHLTEITDGRRSELHLCETCAQKQGFAAQTQLPVEELLNTLLATQSQPDIAAADTQKLTCPHCNMTFWEFRKKSLLGCPADYEVFEDLLRPVIQASHEGKTEHLGKVPSKAPRDTKKQNELLVLRRKLDLAVQKEDYETAAGLRDQINRLYPGGQQT